MDKVGLSPCLTISGETIEGERHSRLWLFSGNPGKIRGEVVFSYCLATRVRVRVSQAEGELKFSAESIRISLCVSRESGSRLQ